MPNSADTIGKQCLRKKLNLIPAWMLAKFEQVYDVKVYALRLVTDHVQLALKRGDSVAGLGQLKKQLAGRQT